MWASKKKGYGFIRVEGHDDGDDIFVYHSDVQEGSWPLVKDDLVTFKLVERERHVAGVDPRKAIDVLVIAREREPARELAILKSEHRRSIDGVPE